MIKFMLNSSFFILKLLIVLAINFVLFLMIPLAHTFFGQIKNNDKTLFREPKIITEYIKPPPKEEKTETKPRIRQIQASPSRVLSQKSTSYKFAPDLTVAGNGDGVAMTDNDLSAVIFEEGEVDKDAEPVSRTPIPYPQRAKELGIEGDLVMVLLINNDGKVSSVEVISSPDQSIAKVAKQIILSSWKFKPAHNQGIPVKQRVKQKISFKLN
ncbi:MAG TPA: TonB family protein [Chitinispirillaceae bacterium]|nr:TonB family protein [Chitinispirillaceae bacterium]